MTTKITKRAMFEAMRSYFEGTEVAIESGESIITEDMLIAFCDKEIASLDKKSAKAKETAAAKKVAGDALRDAVQAVLTDEYATIAEIAEKVEDADATPAKITYRLNKLVELGLAEKTEMTIEGGEGQKKRKVQGYRAI